MPVNAIGQEWRSFVVQGTRFEVENRYSVLNTMGQGHVLLAACITIEELFGHDVGGLDQSISSVILVNFSLYISE